MPTFDVAARGWIGALLALGGLLPATGRRAQPAHLAVWDASEADSWRLIAERHASMTAATWLIWAGVALSIAGVALLARMLGSALSTAALAVFATGAGLALVSLTFEALVVGAGIVRTRLAPRWTGWFAIAMAILLWGQFAAFRPPGAAVPGAHRDRPRCS